MNPELLPVFTFWEGPRRGIIDLCLESIVRHNPTAQVLDEAKARELGAGECLDFSAGLPWPERTDLLRFWLLREFGGVWMDSDVIAVRPFDLLAEVANLDFLGVRNPHEKKYRGGKAARIIATPFGCRKGSPFADALYRRCRDLLAAKKRGRYVPYASTSVGVLSTVAKAREGTDKIRICDHWRYNRVPYYKASLYSERGSDTVHANRPEWTGKTICYHLTNVVTKNARFSDMSAEAVRSDPSFLGFLFRRALGMANNWTPKHYRTAEILRRLPAGPVHGAEIGVWSGGNAMDLLRGNSDLRLVLVDAWTPNRPSYKASKDRKAFFSPKKFRRAEDRARKNVAPFGDRAVFHKGESTAMAAEVAPASLDFVFIDAEHSAEAVTADIAAWRPTVKPGGFLSGHDYNHPNFPGVRQAVDAYASAHGLQVETGRDHTWFIRLPV